MSSGKKHKQKEKKIKKRRARAHTESSACQVLLRSCFSAWLAFWLGLPNSYAVSTLFALLSLSLFLSAKNVFNLLLFPVFRFKLLAARAHKFLIYVCHACCDMVWKITLYFNEFALGLPLATCWGLSLMACGLRGKQLSARQVQTINKANAKLMLQLT